MAIVDVQRLGSDVLKSVTGAAGAYQMLIRVFLRITALANPAVRQILYRQVYFTGFEATSKVIVIGTFIGIVIITQIAAFAGSDAALIGKVLTWVVIRELGPLLAAILVIARSTTAIASELGSMNVNHETNWLRAMGIDPFIYLVVPRVIGTTICLMLLTLYFQAASVVGGLVISSLFITLPLAQTLGDVFLVVGVEEVVISVVKSTTFGLITGSVACYQGLRVSTSITEIPQATSFAVMQSLTLVILADALITVLSAL